MIRFSVKRLFLAVTLFCASAIFLRLVVTYESHPGVRRAGGVTLRGPDTPQAADTRFAFAILSASLVGSAIGVLFKSPLIGAMIGAVLGPILLVGFIVAVFTFA